MKKLTVFLLLLISCNLFAQDEYGVIGIFKAPWVSLKDSNSFNPGGYPTPTYLHSNFLTETETGALIGERIGDSSYVWKSGNDIYPKGDYSWGTLANPWRFSYVDTLYPGIINFDYTLADVSPYRIMRITSNDASKADFMWSFTGNLFGSTYDFTSAIGYNVNQEKVSEPIMSWNIEQDWENGPHHYVESYFQYIFNGQIIRPFFFQVNRASSDGDCNVELQSGSYINFWTTIEDTTYGRFGKTGIFLYGYPGQSTGTVLSVGSQNSKTSSLALEGGFGISALATNDWYLRVNAQPVFHLNQTNVAINDCSLSGAFNVTVPSARKDSDYTLFVKKVASQTTSLFRVVDESSNVYATINNNGYFTLGTHIANKRFNLGDGTDVFSLDIASDKFTLYNDAGTPATLATIDSSGQFLFSNGDVNKPSISFLSYTGSGLYGNANGFDVAAGGQNIYSFYGSGANANLWIRGSAARVLLGGDNSTFEFGGSGLTVLQQDGGNGILGLRSSTTSQEFRIYDTYTSGSIYRRVAFDWETDSTFSIGLEKAGGGYTDRPLTFDGFSSYNFDGIISDTYTDMSDNAFGTIYIEDADPDTVTIASAGFYTIKGFTSGANLQNTTAQDSSITVGKTGKYSVFWKLDLSSGSMVAGTRVNAYLYVNDAQQLSTGGMRWLSGTNDYGSFCNDDILSLTANDVIKIKIASINDTDGSLYIGYAKIKVTRID